MPFSCSMFMCKLSISHGILQLRITFPDLQADHVRLWTQLFPLTVGLAQIYEDTVDDLMHGLLFARVYCGLSRTSVDLDYSPLSTPPEKSEFYSCHLSKKIAQYQTSPLSQRS